MLVKTYNSFADRIRNLALFRRNPTLKELVKYSLVGNISNLIDFGSYVLLTRLFIFWQHHYLTANLISMFLASILRFIFHKYWTFHDSNKNIRIQYLKFIILLIFSLTLNELILFISVEYLKINDVAGKIISIASVTLVVYYFTRTWVFGKSGFKFKKN